MLGLKVAIGKREYPPLAQMSNTKQRTASPEVRQSRGYLNGVRRGKPRFRHRLPRDVAQRLGGFGPCSLGDAFMLQKVHNCVHSPGRLSLWDQRSADVSLRMS